MKQHTKLPILIRSAILMHLLAIATLAAAIIAGCTAPPTPLPQPNVPDIIPVTWDGTPGWFVPNDRLETLLLQLHTKNNP